MVLDLANGEMILRLALAVGLGGLIGIERELSHRPAGLRTHMLVSLGAALFGVLTATVFAGQNPAAFASGIITGIGFIGAGSIIASRGQVHGLTTAASLWTAAAIGLTTAFGFYLLAIFASILVFIILRFREVEEVLEKKKK